MTNHRLKAQASLAAICVLMSFLGRAAAQQPSPNETRAEQNPTSTSFLELLKLANERTRSGQWNEAAELWSTISELNPVEGDVWDHLAQARYQNKDYRRAIPAFQKALELGAGFPCNQAYSIARCYSMLENKAEAMKWFEKAYNLGYRRIDAARSDPELQTLRSDPRFREMIGIIDTGKLSRVQGWRYDLQFLAREFKRRSYDPFRRTSKDDFNNLVTRIGELIPRLTDLEISIELMKLVAKGPDGHTMVYGFWERPEFLETIPVDLYYFDDGLFITAADARHEDLIGAKVLRFGDHRIEEVLKAIDPLISRDNSVALKIMGPMRMRNLPLMHALGLIPEPEKVLLSVVDRDGKARTIILHADSRIPSRRLWDGLPDGWKSFRELSTAPLPLFLKNLYAPYWFEYQPDTKLVYFQFNRVINDPHEPFARFSDRLIRFINAHDVEKLVIDLRWNAGGDTFLLIDLIHGLIRCDKINKRGKLFAIIGNRTYSAAQNAATFIQRHTPAVFVGEPTGSSPNFIGEEDEATFELPFSKLNVNVSYLFWQSSWPMDYRPWIAPLLYTPLKSEMLRANRDPAMEAILSYR